MSWKLLGRFFVVLICLLGGISKFAETRHSEKLLIESYSKTFAKSKEFGFPIPIAPVLIASYSQELIYFTGFLLLLGSLLVIANVKLGSWIITLMFLSFNVVVHNPLIHTKFEDKVNNTQAFLLNLVIVAGCLLTCQNLEDKKKKTE